MEDKKYVILHKPSGIYKKNHGITKNLKSAQTFSSLSLAKNSAMQFRGSFHLRHSLDKRAMIIIPIDEIAVEEYVMKKTKTHSLTLNDINDRLTKRKNREKARRLAYAKQQAASALKNVSDIENES